mmetsp:Transcript_18903/g.43947  ORF Transcript_18903/g.43947 Transcript_18903/m.43947 type:complete len:224 (+) Transcript_18903:1240-1911(+)
MRFESGDQAADHKLPVMPSGLANSFTNSPSFPEYRHTFESEPTDMDHSPSGEYRTQFTKLVWLVWDFSNLNGGPACMITCISSPPVTTRKGRCDLKEIEFTCLACPPTSPVLLPVSHISAQALTSFPSPAATKRPESPLQPMSFTAPLHNLYSFFWACSPLAPHSRTAPVSSPEATHCPFGDNATQVTFFACPLQQRMSSGFSALAPVTRGSNCRQTTLEPLQ